MDVLEITGSGRDEDPISSNAPRKDIGRVAAQFAEKLTASYSKRLPSTTLLDIGVYEKRGKNRHTIEEGLHVLLVDEDGLITEQWTILRSRDTRMASSEWSQVTNPREAYAAAVRFLNTYIGH